MLQAETIVSEFSGSETLGNFIADYDELRVLQRNDENELSSILIEGKLVSRVYQLPTEKSLIEFKRNYEQILIENNFDIITASQNAKGKDINAIRTSNQHNRISKRKYQPKPSITTLARIESQVDYYLYAKRLEENGLRNVVILFNESHGVYAIDELVTAEMQTDMVKITEDALKNALENEGKIAIYDIHFSTGSAEIENSSNEAMDVIGKFLNNNSKINVYVVGHTDDTGNFDHNMKLSSQRANSVVTRLVEEYGVDHSRLKAKGVGPLAPVASNMTEAGKQQNRRVELVRKLNK